MHLDTGDSCWLRSVRIREQWFCAGVWNLRGKWREHRRRMRQLRQAADRIDYGGIQKTPCLVAHRLQHTAHGSRLFADRFFLRCYLRLKLRIGIIGFLLELAVRIGHYWRTLAFGYFLRNSSLRLASIIPGSWPGICTLICPVVPPPFSMSIND